MQYVIYEKKGRIACITLNRPDRLNAFGSQMTAELDEAEADFATDNNLWVAIYTGAGEKAFCAGMDLHEAAERGRTSGSVRSIRPGFSAPEHWKPTIAAVNGYAYGGGFERALSCDIRVCSENATFALSEVKRGLTPVTGLLSLPRALGLGPAMWYLLSGEPMNAQDAYRLGLVVNVVPKAELMPTAMQMAETICQNGPLAVRAVKQAARLGFEAPPEYAQRLAGAIIDAAWSSEDAMEGASAFSKGRKPVYRGR